MNQFLYNGRIKNIMKKAYPSKEQIRDTLLTTNKSYRQIAFESGLSLTSVLNIIDLINYHFSSYEKIIAYCRTQAPEKDWNYIPITDLLLFFSSNRVPNKLAKKYGYTNSIKKSLLSQGCLPKIDTYTLLCNIKSKMEAENQCLE